jgi:hypothetical protein
MQGMIFMEQAYNSGKLKTVLIPPETYIILSHHANTDLPISGCVYNAINKAVPCNAFKEKVLVSS